MWKKFKQKLKLKVGVLSPEGAIFFNIMRPPNSETNLEKSDTMLGDSSKLQSNFEWSHSIEGAHERKNCHS